MESSVEEALETQSVALAAVNGDGRTGDSLGARMQFDAQEFRAKFDHQPFPFIHNLQTLEQFSPERLLGLARRFDQAPLDYFVSAAAPAADSEFFKVAHGMCKPSEAMARLSSEPIRILLKRPENHDPAFRRLLEQLFAQVVEQRPELRGQTVVRLEAGIFITSAASITPFHFDPEINFFLQLEGSKEYHVYAPAALQARELERFYIQGQVSIGQVDLQDRNSEFERVYQLLPGAGFHQPQNSPHWVQTQSSRSVSYAFVYETELTRRRNRARAYNYYLRRAGLDPAEPGSHPSRDALKSATMRILIPARRAIGAGLRALRGR